MAVIETSGLTKAFAPGRGVFDLDLAVAEHEIFGFLGPNGAGKTTTIRLLLDFLRPAAGHARVFGLDTRRQSVAIRAKLGYVPGEVHLPEHLTGREFIAYQSALRGSAVPERRLAELVSALDFDPSLRMKTLSKGNKQKMALIQAMVHDPPLLVLDEPTEGLDPLMQHTFYGLLEAYRAAGGTVFMSSHVLPEVERVCDRVAIIRAGRLAVVESVADLVGRKVRNLEVVFGADIQAAAFLDGLEGVTVRSWENRRANFAVAGAVDPVLKRLAAFPVADLTFAPASLEEAFMDYYRQVEP